MNDAPPQAPPPNDLRLSELAHLGLLLGGGLLCAALIGPLAEWLGPATGSAALLLLAASAAALVVSALWFVLLGLKAGPVWGTAWCLGVWIPYLNFVLASWFARRYWRAGARGPALLGVGALLVQSGASLLLLLPTPPILI